MAIFLLFLRHHYYISHLWNHESLWILLFTNHNYNWAKRLISISSSGSLRLRMHWVHVWRHIQLLFRWSGEL